MRRKFMLLEDVNFMLSGAIPESEVLCTSGSDGRLIIRFWFEMSDEEIVDVLICLVTEFSIEGALRRLGYFKRYKTVRFGNLEGSIPEILMQISLENDLSELNVKSLDIDEDELDVLIRAVSPNIERRSVMQGIAIRPTNQPAPVRIVKP